ncbi:MAG: hypothetical protein ACR2FY_18595 [Pirellulaceae bacterium]
MNAFMLLLASLFSTPTSAPACSTGCCDKGGPCACSCACGCCETGVCTCDACPCCPGGVCCCVK